MSVIGPVVISSDQLDGKADSMDAFSALNLTRLDTIKFDARREGAPWTSLRVTLDRSQAYLSSPDNDPLIAGVRLNIEQLLRTRRRRISNFSSRWGVPVFMGLGMILVILALIIGGNDDKIGPTTFAATIGAGGALWLVVGGLFFLGQRSAGEILLVSRETQPGWVQRNKDSLTVGVIVGVFTLVCGFFLGRLTQ